MKLGVCYYPEQWSQEQWKQDSQEMRELGIQVVRIAEFGWALMEPTEGNYQWQWLDEAVEVLGQAGLEVILGTPTAAPPKWLVNQYPEILPYDVNGKQLKFGSRRHYTFASQVYQEYCSRIVTQIAKRYGQNPFVKAWQIDNEYGDHNTILSFGELDRLAFRVWLKKYYQSIDRLNKAWGCVFWSMMYHDFDQIDLPNEGTEEPTPTAWFDYYRFSSDQVIAFNKKQVDILRKYSPNRPLLHNYMSGTTEFDHYQLGEDLEIAAFDSYPLGGVIHSWLDDEVKAQFLRTGIPDRAAFYHDLYRRVGKGRLWIMEQQPGPVNWAAYNPAPLEGMVRLWTMEAFAHGAEVVSYFRWRQVRYAQEQFHTGLHLPNGQKDQAALEVQQVFAELQQLPLEEKQQAEIALIHDYQSLWALQALPQGKTFIPPTRYSFEPYTAIRQLGLDVDIISPQDSFAGYKIIVLANAIIDDPKLAQRLCQFNGIVLIMPRSASKTNEMWIPEPLPIGSLRQLIDVQVNRVESLPAYHKEWVQWQNQTYLAQHWRENIHAPSAQTLATFEGDYCKGAPALVQDQQVFYLATWANCSLMQAIMSHLCQMAGIQTISDLKNVRLTRRGNLTFALNYGTEIAVAPIPENASIILGQKTLAPADLVIWKETKV